MHEQALILPNGKAVTARITVSTVKLPPKSLGEMVTPAVARPTLVCPSLGGPSLDDGLLVLDVLCTTCQGKVIKRKNYVVHQCLREDIGRCNPSYSCSSDSISDKIVSGVDALPCKFCRFNPLVIDSEKRQRAKSKNERAHVEEFELHQKSLAQYYGVSLTPTFEEIENGTAI